MTNYTPANGEPTPSYGSAAPDTATTVQQPVTNPYAPSGAPVPPGAPKGLAITALALGIAAFLTGLVPFLGLLLGLGAVGVGIFALVKKQPKALAITGTALGGIALITGLIVAASFGAFMSGLDSTQTDETAITEPVEEVAAPAEEEIVEEPVEQEPVEEAPAAAAPAPAADQGSVGNPFPQPYTAKGFFGGEKYTLTARIYDGNANAAVKNWNQFNSDAPAGFKYVVVELSMTGIDPDGVEPSLAEWDLTLATAEGNQYNSEFIVLGDGMSMMSDGPTLYPGSSFTGYTAYLVPEASEGFLLHDNGEYISF